jgi:hypothetical protein
VRGVGVAVGTGVDVGVGEDVLGRPAVQRATESEAIITNPMITNNFFSIYVAFFDLKKLKHVNKHENGLYLRISRLKDNT